MKKEELQDKWFSCGCRNFFFNDLDSLDEEANTHIFHQCENLVAYQVNHQMKRIYKIIGTVKILNSIPVFYDKQFVKKFSKAVSKEEIKPDEIKF